MSPIKPKKSTSPLKVAQEVPGSTNGMFIEFYELDPIDGTFGTQDLLAILRAMKIRFPTEAFNELPRSTKRHFVVNTRTGEKFRFTATEERQLAKRVNTDEQ